MLQIETRKYGAVTIYLLYIDAFEITDHLINLLPDELEKLKTIHHPNKKVEFVAIRTLRTHFFGKRPIYYDEIGAPHIEGEGYISISHANGVVGLASSKDFRIGFDLEPIREKVMRVKHKFLSPQELKQCNIDSVEEMIKVWSGKEALYKLAGRKQLIFAEQLLLEKIDALNWKGEIRFSDKSLVVELVIDKKDNFVISINTKPIDEFSK